MKFTDNFVKFETNNRVAKIFYLDQEYISNNLATKLEDSYIPHISLSPKELTVVLDERYVASEINEMHKTFLDETGIDSIGILKNALESSFNNEYEKELFQKVFDNASTYNFFIEKKGLIGWLFNLIGYKPKLYASHPHFLSKILNVSNHILQKTRISSAEWVLVSNRLRCLFDDDPLFTYTTSNDIVAINNFIHIGYWQGLNVFTTHLIDDYVLIGRSANKTNNFDKLIGTVFADLKIDSVKVHRIDSPDRERVIYSRPYKIYDIPGCQVSYAKWNFVYQKETFWNWFKSKYMRK
jgi:hypothetical protein